MSRGNRMVKCRKLTSFQDVDFDLGGGRVVRQALVDARVLVVGPLHQQVDGRVNSLLGDNLCRRF